MLPREVQKQVSQFTERIAARDIAGIIIGSILAAAGIQGVLLPARLLTGGITGIAIMLRLVTEIDIWFWYIILNIPIFVAGYRFVSRRFALYSLLGTITLTIFLGIFKGMNFHIEDVLLSTIFGGAINGIGAGIVFRSKGSSGGTDIIAVLIRRQWGYNLGQTSFVTNLSVIILFAFVSGIELALYSAISIYVYSRIVDVVTSGPQVTRTAMIISGNYHVIADAILHNLQRGCTYLDATGAYSGEEKTIVLVTVGQTQLPRLKEIVFHFDPQAFITVNETKEVYGQGFQKADD